MPSAAGERLALIGWAVLVSAVGVHTLAVRDWRLSDGGHDSVRCPDNTSRPIPVGCPVELTKPQQVLNFVCSYIDPVEVCMWYINGQPIGSTHPKEYSSYGPLSVTPDVANGLRAVVSNFAQGQSDLTLSKQSEASSFEGTEVVCSCQPRGGEQGPTTVTKTIIADKVVV